MSKDAKEIKELTSHDKRAIEKLEITIKNADSALGRKPTAIQYNGKGNALKEIGDIKGGNALYHDNFLKCEKFWFVFDFLAFKIL